MDDQRRRNLAQLVWIVAGLLVIVAAVWNIVGQVQGSFKQFPTRYEAVVLVNGAVYFGRLQGYGGRSPILTEAYYIISQQDPATKQVKNVLVKRGKELHEPDRMYLNSAQILYVEPVGPDSKVAQLIAQDATEHK
jgi:hypothetical protein